MFGSRGFRGECAAKLEQLAIGPRTAIWIEGGMEEACRRGALRHAVAHRGCRIQPGGRHHRLGEEQGGVGRHSAAKSLARQWEPEGARHMWRFEVICRPRPRFCSCRIRDGRGRTGGNDGRWLNRDGAVRRRRARVPTCAGAVSQRRRPRARRWRWPRPRARRSCCTSRRGRRSAEIPRPAALRGGRTGKEARPSVEHWQLDGGYVFFWKLNKFDLGWN
jgi:hypothetical protein